MRRIQYLTLFSASALTRIAKTHPSGSVSVLTDGIGTIHWPVSLQHAAIRTAKNIDNSVRRNTFDRNQNGSLYLEQR